MNGALFLIGAIVLLGSLYVLLPLMFHTFQRYRFRRVVDCPEAGKPAEVELDAPKAALSSAFGKPKLKIRGCTLWPMRKNCNELCVEKKRNDR